MGIDRHELLDWLLPHCEADVAAVSYPKSRGSGPGWIHGKSDFNRAVQAYRNGSLEAERFESTTKDGSDYTIEGASRIGLVLHLAGMVSVFCVDLDDHTDDGGNVHLLGALSRFFGATPVVFTSKGGKGQHAFFQLQEPITCEEFVSWFRAWGFNRGKEPEIFPKTEKLTQVFLPNEPNEDLGDTYQSGDFDSCVVSRLPTKPSIDLTNRCLQFLRGQTAQSSRNAELNSTAYALGNKGMPRPEAWALCQRGARLCGLEESETLSTFESGYSAGLRETTIDTGQVRAIGDQQYAHHGIGNGERFAAQHGDSAKYCFALKDWLVWDTNRWAIKPERIECMAKLCANTIEDPKHQKSTSTKRGIEELLYLARSEPGITVGVDTLDADPMLLNCHNGTVNLRNGSFRSHDRSEMHTKISPAWFDETAQCPRWDAFLDRIFGSDCELIGYMRRVAGYMLTGDVSEQCLFFMHGNGCNGKSVFASILMYILGDYSQRAPAELILKPERSSGGATPDKARLRGSRLVITSELEEGQQFGEALIKDLTGGDRIVARQLYKEPIEFDPTHKLLLYGNHLPSMTGVDHGIWRRIRQIPFNVTIPESERDPHLIDALKAEANGILAWAVRGCLAWQVHGLSEPEAVLSATSAYRKNANPLNQFIDECCVVADGVTVSKGELNDAFAEWCIENNEKKVSGKMMSSRLHSLGFADGRNSSERYWIGLELNSDATNGGLS
ncbi:MAG: DNA primase family protein [Phycisphaerales bacterium]